MTTCPDSPAVPDILAELRAESPLWGGRHRKLLADAADEIVRLRARAADLEGKLAEVGATWTPPDETRPATISLNDEVLVRLTDRGRAIVKADLDRAGIPEHLRLARETDSDGRERWSLWELAHTFGPALYHGANDLPFEGTAMRMVRGAAQAPRPQPRRPGRSDRGGGRAPVSKPCAAPPIVDRTAHAPASYRGRTRAPDEPDLACLHQTAVGRDLWPEDSPAWDRVRAHYVVTPAGSIRCNHEPRIRLRYGSRWWNPRAVTIEIAGNFPTCFDAHGRPVWWSPERMGQDLAPERPEQIHAARALLAYLRATMPALRYLGAHRQIERAKAGCPGPSVWAEIGEFALAHLGYQLAPTDPRGLDIPRDWRTDPTIPQDATGATLPGRQVTPTDRSTTAPTAVSVPSPFAPG